MGPIQSPNKDERGKQKAKRERDQIKYIDLRLERWQAVRFRKARRQDALVAPWSFFNSGKRYSYYR